MNFLHNTVDNVIHGLLIFFMNKGPMHSCKLHNTIGRSNLRLISSMVVIANWFTNINFQLLK